MITVIARWDTGQMSPLKEWNMWGQLRGAFGITRFKFVPVHDYMSNVDIDQYETMEEALASLPEDTLRVFLEPTGCYPVHELERDSRYQNQPIAVIVGNTDRDNMAHAKIDETFSIHTLGKDRHNHLYGTNAVAIALALRLGQ